MMETESFNVLMIEGFDDGNGNVHFIVSTFWWWKWTCHLFPLIASLWRWCLMSSMQHSVCGEEKHESCGVRQWQWRLMKQSWHKDIEFTWLSCVFWENAVWEKLNPERDHFLNAAFSCFGHPHEKIISSNVWRERRTNVSMSMGLVSHQSRHCLIQSWRIVLRCGSANGSWRTVLWASIKRHWKMIPLSLGSEFRLGDWLATEAK